MEDSVSITPSHPSRDSDWLEKPCYRRARLPLRGQYGILTRFPSTYVSTGENIAWWSRASQLTWNNDRDDHMPVPVCALIRRETIQP